jgi:hypothetical protein
MFEFVLTIYNDPTIECVRNEFGHRFNPLGVVCCFSVWLAGWHILIHNRHITRFKGTSTAFKYSRAHVKQQWGPPPPRRYDDNGNIIDR